jgi:hypothetical protein
MKMQTRAATLEEIGRRLEEALTKSGKVPLDIVTQIDGTPSVTGWYRWVRAESEAGCRTIVQAGLALGVRPDALLLKEEGDAVFTIADEVAISQIRTLIGELNKIYRDNSDVRPVDVIVSNLQKLLEMAHERAGLGSPADLKGELRIHTETIKPADAPPLAVAAIELKAKDKPKKKKPGGSGSWSGVRLKEDAAAGEEPAAYGVKRSKKKK